MAQPAYDALSEKKRLESAGFAAPQAEAIVETMTRTTTGIQQMAQELNGVKSRLDGVENRLDGVESRLTRVENNLSEVKIDLAEVKVGLTGLKDRSSEMVTSKHLDAAIAGLRADMYRALWVQGLTLGTLILGLAVAVAGVAVF